MEVLWLGHPDCHEVNRGGSISLMPYAILWYEV